MALMIIGIWIIVYLCLELHCVYIKKYEPHNWNRRQFGMISFTNKQFFYMRLLWPITTVVSLVLIFILLIFAAIKGM